MATSIIKKGDIKTQTLTLSGHDIQFYTNDNGVVMCYAYFSNMPSGTYKYLGALPEELRPASPYVFSYLLTYEQPYLMVGTLWIGNNGAVTIYKPNDLAKGYTSCTYLAG